VVVVDQGFAVNRAQLQVEPCGAEGSQERRSPVELHVSAAHEQRPDVAAIRLVVARSIDAPGRG